MSDKLWEYPRNMMLHKSTYKIFISLAGLIAVDLITRSLWLILLYIGAWAYVMLRKSDNVMIKGLTSPCNGQVSEITTTRTNGADATKITINTMPVVDAQDFVLLGDSSVTGIEDDGANKIIRYKSGASVAHAPNFGISLFELAHNDSASEDPVYGYSIFGGTTTVTLPEGYTAIVHQGQKVVAGQTLIGEL